METRGNDGFTALLKAIQLKRFDTIKIIIEISRARVTATKTTILFNDIM